jgi:uncharacterized protein (DUF433 family)
LGLFREVITMIDQAKKSRGFDLYGGSDPADLPRYSYLEAAQATDVPASTVGLWMRGMPHRFADGAEGFYAPVIARPSEHDTRLSFNNLLEIYVLRALRKVHEVKLQKVRKAIDIARDKFGIERLLLDEALRVSGRDLFLDTYFELVSLSNSTQFVIRDVLESSLQRIRVDELKHVSLFPPRRKPELPEDARLIVVSPYIAFGSAVIERRGITTSAIRSRFDLGEDREAIIADYRLKPEEFDEAIHYELAA